jgi:hypothetical protein
MDAPSAGAYAPWRNDRYAMGPVFVADRLSSPGDHDPTELAVRGGRWGGLPVRPGQVVGADGAGYVQLTTSCGRKLGDDSLLE